MWDAQASARVPGLRPDVTINAAHGMTEAPAGPVPFSMLLADAVALMDALEIRRTHFCGLSLGGATALGLAEQHPDRASTAPSSAIFPAPRRCEREAVGGSALPPSRPAA